MSFACLLSLTNVYKHRKKVQKFVVNYTNEYFNYDLQSRQDFWFFQEFVYKTTFKRSPIDNNNSNDNSNDNSSNNEFELQFFVPVFDLFKQLIIASAKGDWHFIVESIIDIGFKLLDNGHNLHQTTHKKLFLTNYDKHSLRNSNNNSTGNSMSGGGNYVQPMGKQQRKKLYHSTQMNHKAEHLSTHISKRTESTREGIVKHNLTTQQSMGLLGCFILKSLYFTHTKQFGLHLINKVELAQCSWIVLCFLVLFFFYLVVGFLVFVLFCFVIVDFEQSV